MSKPADFKFDSRIRTRLLRNRALTSAEVQTHLEALPDLEGEYELMEDVPQPAVTPPRSEVVEEPIVFDGIRRLQALAAVGSAPPPSGVHASAPLESGYGSSGVPTPPEPVSPPQAPGAMSGGVPPLQSALSSTMESEISGVGAGAVSAALGAMAAEAAGVPGFGSPPPEPPAAPPAVEPPPPPPAPEPPRAPAPPAIFEPPPAPVAAEPAPSEPEPVTPVTLRSEGDAAGSPPANAAVSPFAAPAPSPAPESDSGGGGGEPPSEDPA